MLKFIFYIAICIFGALASNAMESQKSHRAWDSGESEHRYLFELLDNLHRSDVVSKALFNEAYGFITQNIGQLDKLPQEIFEIYCAILVELDKCTVEKSFEEICFKLALMENENSERQINYLVNEFPVGKPTKVKRVCCKIANIMFKYGYEPSEILINFITREIFTTQNQIYFETLKCFYINLIEENYIQLSEALNLAESCQEDFKSYFLVDLGEKLSSVKNISRRTNDVVDCEDKKVRAIKNLHILEESKRPKKDNCIIS